MKKLPSIAITIVNIFILLVSCSKDDIDNLTLRYRIVKIKYDNGTTTNFFYNNSNQIKKISDSSSYNFQEFYYDSKGRIERVIENSFLYSGEYTETYHYQGELLSCMTFNIASGSASFVPDSVCFIYDNKNCLSQKTDFYGGKLLKMTNYFYNANKKLIQSISHNSDDSYFDTTNYQWNIDGNLVKMNVNYYNQSNNEYIHHYYEENYEYYDHKNYLFNIQYPEIYFLYHFCYASTMDEKMSNNYIKEQTSISGIHSKSQVYNVTSYIDSLPTKVERSVIDGNNIRTLSWDLEYER